MKKRILVGLAVTTVIISVAIWKEMNTWEKVEAGWRQSFLRDARDWNQGHPKFDITVYKPGSEHSYAVGSWNENQMKNVLEGVHLQPAKVQSIRSKANYWILYGNDSSEYCGMVLETKNSRGEFSFSFLNGDRWRNLEFTPQSCRVIEKRIWRDFGPKLRALKIPPS